VRFANGSVRVLVATDVAARGLDIKSLALVVNFDNALCPAALSASQTAWQSRLVLQNTTQDAG
jgi:superfamily II DNA/RNA helicase